MTNLYRIPDVDVNTINGFDAYLKDIRTDRATKLAHEERISKKRAGRWRTIILSSLGKTSYPYSQYIQTLDLEDLKRMLTDSHSGIRDFFQGELAQLNELPAYVRLNDVDTITRIGEVITKQTPLLKELSADVCSETLSRWIPRLPRLIYLKTPYGVNIEGNGNLMRLYCHSFEGLSFYRWGGSNFDHGVAAFLNELRPQSLESFKMYEYESFRPQSLEALSCHGESLTKLKFKILSTRTGPKLSLLKDCTNLVSLSVAANEPTTIDLEGSCKGEFLETVAWLKRCKKLRTLDFTRFFSAPALMAAILSENSICLTSLSFQGEGLPHTKDFHKALANQTSLKYLFLREEEFEGEYDQAGQDEADILVESMSKLTNLTDLRLRNLSSYFTDQHIMRLANSLPKLEVWSTNGRRLTNASLNAVASLRSLRAVELGGLANCSADEVLDFIEKLGPGNKSMILSMESDSLYDKMELIDEKIKEKVGGMFDCAHVISMCLIDS